MILNRKKQIETLLLQNKNTLCEMGVKSIGIFGSVVKGDDNENSDYDILVEFKKGCRKFYNFNKLCEFFENKTGNKFDLVTKD
ncbi:MAG: nucleotidyltransferase family protein, partial [Candidatus Anammoxibacter sp.]